jgi:hypothetical protein
MSTMAEVEVLYRDGTYPPQRIAHDEENVYWSDGPIANSVGENVGYEIYAMSKKTRESRVVAKNNTLDLAFLESGGYIYKLDRSRIKRFRSSGGIEEVVSERPDNGFAPLMAASPSGLLCWFTEPESGGLLQVMSIKDRETATIIAGEHASYGRVIADHDSVYWIGAGGLKVISLQGGKPHTIFPKGCGTNALVADTKYVYFMGPEGLMRACKEESSEIHLIGKIPTAVSSLALDDHFVYYASRSWPDSSAGQIDKIPKSGGAAQKIVGGLNKPDALLVDSKHVYFTDAGNRTVARVVH